MESEMMRIANSVITGQRLAVVLNVVDIQCARPRELMPGCQLSRATPEEILQIDSAEARAFQYPDTPQLGHRSAPIFTSTLHGRMAEFVVQPPEQ